MNTRSGLFIVLAIVFYSISLSAKTPHAPLPKDVMNAKTVYIDNKSGFANIGDRAYDELRKWGRFKIVDNPKDADIVLLLSSSAYEGGYTTTGTINATTTDYGSTSQTTGTVSTQSHPVTHRYTHITLVNPKTGDNLWSDSRPWGYHFHSATRGILQEFRKRVEEQEKSPETH